MTSLSVVGNTDSGNLNTGGVLSATGNVIGANLTTAGIVSATGNVCTAANVLASGYISATGNVRGANLVAGNIACVIGNVEAGNVNTAGLVSATGNITGANVNTGIVSATGNVNGLNVNTGIVSATGNIDGLNVNTTCISATSNVTASWFIGNICGNITGNIAVPGNTTEVIFNNSGNAGATAGFTFNSTSNAVSITGNVTSNNVNTGIVSATGNVDALNVNTAIVSATGNVDALNVNTAIVSATGNVNGLNVNTAIVSATGNVIGANMYANSGTIGASLLTGTLTTNAQPNVTSVGTLTSLSVSGNVDGGNFNTAGAISATGDITANNFVTSGTGGNITGANVVSANTFVATAAVCTVNLNANGITCLGNVGNVRIFGGNAGDILTTDGNGNISWQLETEVYNDSNVCNLLCSGTIDVNIITTANICSNNATLTNNLTVSGSLINAQSAAACVSSVTTGTCLLVGTNANIGTTAGGTLRVNGDINVAGNPSNSDVGNITVTLGNITAANGFVCGANVCANFLYGNGQNISYANASNIYGSLNNTTCIYLDSGDITANSGNITTISGNIAAPGGNIYALYDITATGSLIGNVVCANYIIGNGNSITNVRSITNTTSSVCVSGPGGNIEVTSAGCVWTFDTTGNLEGPANKGATFGWFAGDGANLSNITGANICGNISNVCSLTANGNVTACNISITGGVITGACCISGVYLAATCDISATGNITSNTNITAVGSITGGNILTAGSVSATGNITADFFNGNGCALSGMYANANLAAYLANSAEPAGNIFGDIFTANGNIQSNANVITDNILGLSNAGISICAVGTNANINLVPTGNAANVLDTGFINASCYSIINVRNPTNNQDAATKAYVDGIANGLQLKAPVNAATIQPLSTSVCGGAYTYNNGTAGVGATITAAATGPTVIDGVTLTTGMRVLIKDEPQTASIPAGTTPSAAYNGIYTVTTAGSGSAALVLTRATDDNTPALMYSAYTFTLAGTDNINSSFASTNVPSSPITVGTTFYNFIEFSQIPTYTGGNAISVTGTVIDALYDGTSIDLNVSNQLHIPPGATLGTPNIGVATGTSLAVTGNITSANVIANATVHIANSTITYANATTTSTSPVTLFTGATNVSYELLIKATDTVQGHISLSKILATSGGDYIVYGQATSGSNPGTFSVTAPGGNVTVQITAASSNNTAWSSQIRGV